VAVPNIAELISTIKEQSHPILDTIDVNYMFFMVPLQESDLLGGDEIRERPSKGTSGQWGDGLKDQGQRWCFHQSHQWQGRALKGARNLT